MKPPNVPSKLKFKQIKKIKKIKEKQQKKINFNSNLGIFTLTPAPPGISMIQSSTLSTLIHHLRKQLRNAILGLSKNIFLIKF